MAEKEKMAFSDKNIVPTDEHIFSVIGERNVHWKRIMDHISENYKETSGSWNYYNDGKQWLYKMVHKKKTIFWAAILSDTFRITFYFGDKAEPIIDASDLPQKIKDEFKTSKRYGLIRGISFLINDSEDVDNVIRLIAIKHNLK